jgi:membrane protein DedA with SNARE-associated domain
VKHRTAARWTVALAAVLSLIVVPFLIFGEALEFWALRELRTLSQHPGPVAALLAVLLASDVFLPIPSSLVSSAAGVLLGPWLGTAASFVGMTVGCGIGYWVGRAFGRGAERRLLTPDDLADLNRLASRHGKWFLVVARPLPVLAEASVIFAGMSAMPPGRFLAQVAMSNLGISSVYAVVGGYAAGQESFLLAVAGAVLAPLLVTAALRQSSR